MSLLPPSFFVPAGQDADIRSISDNADTHRRLISCGRDQTIKIWASPVTHRTGADFDESQIASSSASPFPSAQEETDPDLEAAASSNLMPQMINSTDTPLFTYSGKYSFNSIHHHRSDPVFATASNCVQIWDESRSSPLSTLAFGSSQETVTSVRFNQSETSVLASVGTDRSMVLYDVRTGKAERRVRMAVRHLPRPPDRRAFAHSPFHSLQFKSNSLAWCPTLPTVMLLASEDHNLYTFDVRNLASPTQIYKDHVAAVMGCDWSPTGEQFVSGSWDRTIRIWDRTEGRSKDVYHTKRMQRYARLCASGRNKS